ncbi:MAG: 30S ribosomal protein S3 [Fusobacteria bacterium]|nr:30S ribosomal protein S3 [Fusobacteriota bacterium]
MGQKVDPRGLRLGITRTWESVWYAGKEKYASFFHEDVKLKEYIKKNYYHAGISKIGIERTSDAQVTITVYTAKAGILIGRKGKEIEELKAKLEKITNKDISIKVQEIKNPNLDAQLVAENIAGSIERRVAFKRAMNQAIGRAEKLGVKGIKVAVSGRLNGAEIARREWTISGRVPLHTLRADIDYATAEAHTTYGILGIKVWIFNGEVLPTKKEEGGEA